MAADVRSRPPNVIPRSCEARHRTHGCPTSGRTHAPSRAPSHPCRTAGNSAAAPVRSSKDLRNHWKSIRWWRSRNDCHVQSDYGVQPVLLLMMWRGRIGSLTVQWHSVLGLAELGRTASKKGRFTLRRERRSRRRAWSVPSATANSSYSCWKSNHSAFRHSAAASAPVRQRCRFMRGLSLGNLPNSPRRVLRRESCRCSVWLHIKRDALQDIGGSCA